MKRTQIQLGETEIELLEGESRVTGASKSELIRRAIRERYAGDPAAPRRRPRSIGIAASGRIDAANDEELLRQEFDRLWPPRQDPAA